MGSKKVSRSVAALVLVIGLIAAPAAMADGNGDPQTRGGLFATFDQVVHDLLVEVTGWFGVTYSEQSTDDDTSDDGGGWSTGFVGLDGNECADGTTDCGPGLDPDG